MKKFLIFVLLITGICLPTHSFSFLKDKALKGCGQILTDSCHKHVLCGSPNFCMIEHWKNLSLDLIVEEHEGVVYTEEWKPIEGYETQYEISSFGRVKSLNYWRKKGEQKILGQSRCGRYLRVDLVTKTNHHAVHRLVGVAFVSNPDNKPQINHLFSNGCDNRFHQLEWSTQKENVIHGWGLGRKSVVEHLVKHTVDSQKAVRQLDIKTGVVIAEYPSQKDAARAMGVLSTNINKACQGVYKKSAGYKWEYA